MALTDGIVNQREIPRWLPWAVGLLLIVRVAAMVLEKDDRGELVQWVPLAQAEAEARKSGKPIMYDFSAAWCGPCRQMDAVVFNDTRMAAQINKNVIPVRVVDRQQEDGKNMPAVAALQRRYSVRAFPTVVIADAGGEQRERLEGFRGREPFVEILGRAARLSQPRRDR